MDGLRIILLIGGIAFVLGIYLWETRWRRRSSSNDLDDLDTSYLDDLGDQRSRRDFGYTRKQSDPAREEPDSDAEVHPEPWQALQEDLPFGEAVNAPDAPAAPDAQPPEGSPRNREAGALAAQRAEPTIGNMDFVIPGDDDDRVDVEVNRLDAFSSAPPTRTPSNEDQPSLVIALTLMTATQEPFDGGLLRQALEAVGFVHGEMNAFHYFDGSASGRRPLCTIVNVLNPGTFDLDSMHEMTTPGLAMFMEVSGDGSGSTNLDKMLKLGEVLAGRLGGQLMDETRSRLTSQAVNHLREKIAEFSRQQRIRR